MTLDCVTLIAILFKLHQWSMLLNHKYRQNIIIIIILIQQHHCFLTLLIKHILISYYVISFTSKIFWSHVYLAARLCEQNLS